MQSAAAETMSPAAVQSAAADKHGRSRSRKKKNNVNGSSSSLGKKRKSDDGDDLRMEKPNKKSKGKVQLSNDNEVIAAAGENLTVAGGGDVGSGKVAVTASFLSDSRYVFVFINLGFFPL